MTKADQTSLFGTGRSAIISPCERYRYELRDVWDSRLPLVGFCGLNPSIATATVVDHTTTKWSGFAARLGFGGWVAVNAFAWRDKSRKNLRAAHAAGEDVVGPDNDRHIVRVASEVQTFVVCWGIDGVLAGRDSRMAELLSDVPCKCWGFTANKQPLHPLMLGYDTPLMEWRRETGVDERQP